MAEPEETAAQRQARIRREKRQAKINANASDRLDKITRLSGRTPESMRKETSTPLSGTSTPPATSTQPQQPNPQMPSATSPEQAKMQEEYLKALLKGPPQGQDQEQNQPPLSQQDDPMIKMLGSLMGGMNPNGDPSAQGDLPFNPDDLSKATGMPSFLTNMFMGNQKAPPTPEEVKSTRIWRLFHVVFAVLSGFYYLYAIGTAENAFGTNPPAPATFQNPFVLFVLGEILLQTVRILTGGPSGKRGPRLWYQMVKEFAGDGAVIVFLLGGSSWWKGIT